MVNYMIIYYIMSRKKTALRQIVPNITLSLENDNRLDEKLFEIEYSYGLRSCCYSFNDLVLHFTNVANITDPIKKIKLGDITVYEIVDGSVTVYEIADGGVTVHMGDTVYDEHGKIKWITIIDIFKKTILSLSKEKIQIIEGQLQRNQLVHVTTAYASTDNDDDDDEIGRTFSQFGDNLVDIHEAGNLRDFAIISWLEQFEAYLFRDFFVYFSNNYTSEITHQSNRQGSIYIHGDHVYTMFDGQQMFEIPAESTFVDINSQINQLDEPVKLRARSIYDIFTTLKQTACSLHDKPSQNAYIFLRDFFISIGKLQQNVDEIDKLIIQELFDVWSNSFLKSGTPMVTQDRCHRALDALNIRCSEVLKSNFSLKLNRMLKLYSMPKSLWETDPEEQKATAKILQTCKYAMSDATGTDFNRKINDSKSINAVILSYNFDASSSINRY
jgi:hypothetical protein